MIDISKITLGRYAPRNSWIHNLDPRTKLLAIFGLMGFSLAWQSLLTLFLFFSALLIIYQSARLSPSLALYNIRSFYVILLLTWGLHLLTTPGKVFLTLPLVHLQMTYEGLKNGFFYTFRIINLIILANLLTLTTSPMDFTDGLEKLMLPLKRIHLPAHEIAMMISIALRFIPILLEEVERIRRAQVSRGARFDGGILQRIRGIIPIIVPLFISTFRRANDLALAMEARCYRGGENRSCYHQLRFQNRDYMVLSVVFIVILPLVIWG